MTHNAYAELGRKFGPFREVLEGMRAVKRELCNYYIIYLQRKNHPGELGSGALLHFIPQSFYSTKICSGPLDPV